MTLEVVIDESHVLVRNRRNNAVQTKIISLDSLAKAVSRCASLDTGFLDPHVVRYIRDAGNVLLINYDPPNIRRVTYYQRETYVIPTPPNVFLFLFKEDNNYWKFASGYVFSVKDRFINDSTLLYYFPFANVGVDGHICWGSVPVAGNRYQLSSASTDLINNFWTSSFNSDLYSGGSTRERFRALHESQVFPLDDLQPSGVGTLSRAIGNVMTGRAV